MHNTTFPSHVQNPYGCVCFVIGRLLVRFPCSASRSVLGQHAKPQTAPDVLVNTSCMAATVISVWITVSCPKCNKTQTQISASVFVKLQHCTFITSKLIQVEVLTQKILLEGFRLLLWSIWKKVLQKVTFNFYTNSLKKSLKIRFWYNKFS